MKPIQEKPAFIKNIVDVMNRQEGDNLPVSAFNGYEDGTFLHQEQLHMKKRRIAINVPEWQQDNCIHVTNVHSYVLTAVIRPFLLTEEEAKRCTRRLQNS